MSNSKAKLYKKAAEKPSQLEETVAQALFDIENSSTDLKNDVKDLYIASAKEIETTIKGKKGKNIILISVPVPCLKLLNKVHARLVPELEKKLKNPVLFIAKRTIQSKWLKTHKSQMRPRNRTLTSVHDSILEDLVLPGSIIGRRIRHRLDGSTVMKVALDQNDEPALRDKIDAIAHIYKKLTTKEVQFEFRQELSFYTLKK